MNTILKIFLSMSFSGGLLILALLLGKRLLKDKISRQWQYYIWLIVIFRLLLPFDPETNLLGKTYQSVDQMITQAAPLTQQKSALYASENIPTPADNQGSNSENNPSEDLTATHRFQEIGVLLINHIWLIWLVVALGMLIRKITSYQGFIRYIHAGLAPISDIEILDQLSIIAEQIGIKKPIELCVNSLISSPLLIGLFHPCVVLPSVDIPEKDFRYIILHELTHYKRRDMFYKWLVQITLCLHWFNPLVHLMNREITKACEFSCDEAVLTKMGQENAQNYGNTLLNAMAAVGKYKENLGAVTLSENKQILKERLGAIMNFKRKSTAIRLLTGMLTLSVMFGAVFVGVYSAAVVPAQTAGKAQVSGGKNSTQTGTSTRIEEPVSQVERYYKADSLPLFEITFSRLDESTQRTWLEKLYTDGDFAFFSGAVRGVDTDSPLFADFAEKAYVDGEIAFFSTLTDCMDETELDFWLDRALKDGKWDFQSMLFDRLGRSDEFDKLEDEKEKAWAVGQTAEYQAVGVTMDGKNYYYQGQLVNIFLDIRANQSFYTLDTNPAGTVNIKIIRDSGDKIAGVAYMTEAEVAELLGAEKTSSPSVSNVSTSSFAPDKQPAKTNVSSSIQQGDDREDKFDWDWDWDWDDKFDEKKDKEWATAQTAEYQAIGVTMDGKNYYYQGQLVNIFLDIRANQSFYTLDINPAGTVNIKITRDTDGKIKSVAYMTDAEVTELLTDMSDPDDE